ncbi:MAG TPA: DnaJ domain-containing protein [Burkholderiales bacterium]|nr:DnaJ domain-containing protein [Burkholderiales bacterium]
MLQMIKTHYQVLGVPPTAPPELIRQAYRRVIVRAACSSGEEARHAREELRLARDAFTVLMDPERRAVYDVTCQGWSAPVRASYRA